MISVVIDEVPQTIAMCLHHIGGHHPWTIVADRHHEEEILHESGEGHLVENSEDRLGVQDDQDHHRDAPAGIQISSCSIPGTKNGLGLRIVVASVSLESRSGMKPQLQIKWFSTLERQP
jgi:hypothetical protein